MKFIFYYKKQLENLFLKKIKFVYKIQSQIVKFIVYKKSIFFKYLNLLIIFITIPLLPILISENYAVSVYYDDLSLSNQSKSLSKSLRNNHSESTSFSPSLDSSFLYLLPQIMLIM